jgi:hypothetical protein
MKDNDVEREYLQRIAEKLRRATSGEVSGEAQEILGEMLVTLANEANLGIDDPRIIERTFPLMIELVDTGYGRAMVHSIEAVLDSCLPDTESLAADVLDSDLLVDI